jgi:hypothetical protein
MAQTTDPKLFIHLGYLGSVPGKMIGKVREDTNHGAVYNSSGNLPQPFEHFER